MFAQRKWLWIIALVGAAIAALVFGVSPWLVLILGLVLLCPLAMSGMHKGKGSDHGGMSANSSMTEHKTRSAPVFNKGESKK